MGKEFPANQRNCSFQNLLIPKYVASGKVREVFDISPETLRGWAVKGVVNARAIRNVSGRQTWLYDLESIGRRLEPGVDESALPGGAAKHRSAVVGGGRTQAQETHDEQEAEEGHGEEQEDAGEDCESAAEEVY
ncbi:hypothetical protein PC123_g5780 [Phytophthora cactorum]|nr:hypothetical protein PC123_g5780 [Phytophthora cactorum]